MQEEIILNDYNIKRLLIKLSVPAMIGMFVMSFYNIVDTIFIGRGVGTIGIAALAIAFPIQMIVGAIGQMIGIGGASLLSRSLGEGNYNKANKILGNVIASVTILSLIVTCLSFIFINELLNVFGATETLLPYSKEYLKWILMGIAMHSLAMALNNLVRAEGKAKIAMTTMILSALVNIGLDALLIFGFKMGIRGAAIATLIAYNIAALFLLGYFLTGKSTLQLHIRDIRFDRSIQKEIFAIGISPFVRMTAMSLLIIILNNTLGKYGGDLAIGVYGVIMRMIMFIFTPIMGISQGLQPIAGFHYGAKDYQKTKESVKLAMIGSTIIAIAGTLLLILFPRTLIGIFSKDQELTKYGEEALKYIVLAFPTVGFQIMGTTLFQAMGKATQTFILTLSRQFIFLIPMVIILPHFFHLTGVWISFPIADILSALLTFWMLNNLRNRLSAMMAVPVKT